MVEVVVFADQAGFEDAANLLQDARFDMTAPSRVTITVVEYPSGSQKYYSTDHRRLWSVKSMCKKLSIEEGER